MSRLPFASCALQARAGPPCIVVLLAGVAVWDGWDSRVREEGRGGDLNGTRAWERHVRASLGVKNVPYEYLSLA